MTESKLRVLQLTSGDLWAGAEVQFFTLCAELRQRADIALRAVVLNEGELARKLRANGVDVLVLDETQLSVLEIFRRLFSLLQQWKPHVVHSHRFKENVIGGLAASLLGIASIRTVHGAQEVTTGARDLRRRLIRLLDVAVGRFLQRRVVAVTHDLRQKLLADYSAAHVVTIANGIAFDDLDQAVAESLDGECVVGIVGRLTAVKRVDIFLQMAKLLLSDPPVPGLRFLVVGGGPLQSELEQQAAQLGLVDVVRFAGHVSPVAGVIKALDVLVMCSDHEGMPMTLLEAMRLRTPIVAHRVGGLVELLEPVVDGAKCECATLVSEHTPAGYAAAVRELLCRPPLRAQRADVAFERVGTQFSARANADRFVDLYRTLLR